MRKNHIADIAIVIIIPNIEMMYKHAYSFMPLDDASRLSPLSLLLTSLLFLLMPLLT